MTIQLKTVSSSLIVLGGLVGLPGCGGGEGSNASSSASVGLSSSVSSMASSSSSVASATSSSISSNSSSSSSLAAAGTVYNNRLPARALQFSNSIGVGLHLGSAIYANNIGFLVDDLSYLGFKHVRDSIGGTLSVGFSNANWVASTQYVGSTFSAQSKLQKFAAIGVLFNSALSSDFLNYQARIDQNAAYIESLEGPNEIDITIPTYNGLTGNAAGAAIQQAVYNLVQQDVNLSGKPVLNLTFASPSHSSGIDKLDQYANYSNVHAYPAYGNPPTYVANDNPAHTASGGELPVAIAATVDAPGKPVIMTETGYATNIATSPAAGHSMVSETVQAKYELDAVLDNFKAGVVKTYLYELLDEAVDPNSNPELHLGLFRTDNSAKPVATAFHNLLSILHDGDANAATFAPAPLTYTLQQSTTTTGMDVNGYHLLLQKQNGAYELVMWAEAAIWNSITSTENTVPANLVTITLSHAYQAIKVYDPLQGTTAINQYTNANQLQVSVVDHPLVIEIEP